VAMTFDLGTVTFILWRWYGWFLSSYQ